ncbi:MAG: hypothetical protein IJE43_01305 [Alphaproteobacteria bacterium]|nr:hypothetical protein [Alphaproteobacteria bacterium]MBQ2922330.1 hypothetical protein [Tyzzerella sp.]
MKISLIVIVYLVLALPLKAQESPDAFIKYFNECVNIYNSPEGRDIKLKIFQDDRNETNFYNVYFLEKSPYRFKVRIQAYEYIEPMEGWIDKDCIAVYSRSRQEEIHLYDAPSCDSKYQVLKNVPDIFTVVDYMGIWRKVLFIMEAKLYIGWTKDYCPIVYNSCS